MKLANLPYLVIVLLIGYIFFLRECTPPTIVDHYKTDTVIYHDTAYVPKLDTILVKDTLYLDSIIREVIERERIDTVYLLREHFTHNFYTDTILNDTNGLIVINDTLYRNRVKSRLNQIKLFNQVRDIKIRNKYFVGLGVVGSTDRMGLSANFAVLTKKKKLYSIGYDVINKDISLRFYFTLR